MIFLGSVSQRVQMNLIFPDNLRILCLSCNVKSSNQLQKMFEKSRIKYFSNRFCPLSGPRLYWYHFSRRFT